MAVNYGACEQCWTVSWEPVENEAECALKHPHEGDHVTCEHCELLIHYDKAVSNLAQIREIVQSKTTPSYLLEPILELTQRFG